MTLVESLSRHFKMPRGRDNLPIVANPKPGRDKGRQQLAKVLADLDYRRGIEVGVGGGKSAEMWFAENPNLKLVGIDLYPGRAAKYLPMADKCAKRLGFELIVADSMAVVDRFEDESVDFVHIDGDHTFDGVMQDIIRFVPKVRKGGLIMCHDYCALHNGGVVQAVNAYVHCHRIDPWYITRDCNPVAFWERGTERA